MKRSYQSGAKKRQDKKKREEDASKCSSTLSAWLCPTTSTTTTKSTNVTSTSSTETRPIIASVPGNEIEEEVTAQDNAEESIDEEVTCLGLGHQQEKLCQTSNKSYVKQ
ncbi:uncharacterized protein LOC124374274 [Homalodisca vitripennis]|uniref:uncharacterized protein LOC124374274 n=1 Tax=Homalodisca vitripennis TaxID=197043 RepID=UPI001EEAB215|nr:uncharacterized protein LOC124374274 [Homalodisca vitripennis]